MAEEFKIEDDKTADWAIQTIAAEEQERDRLITLAQEQIQDLTDRIEELKKKYENSTAYLRSCLYEYFRTIKPKETKTQKSYKLLSGTLVFKKPSVKIIHNDEKLIEYLKANDSTDFIKVKESVDWAGFKANLTVTENDEIVDTGIGTIIPSDVCTVEEVPGSFDIKF